MTEFQRFIDYAQAVSRESMRNPDRYHNSKLVIIAKNIDVLADKLQRRHDNEAGRANSRAGQFDFSDYYSATLAMNSFYCLQHGSMKEWLDNIDIAAGTSTLGAQAYTTVSILHVLALCILADGFITSWETNVDEDTLRKPAEFRAIKQFLGLGDYLKSNEMPVFTDKATKEDLDYLAAVAFAVNHLVSMRMSN